jgi:hypothetical protein
LRAGGKLTVNETKNVFGNDCKLELLFFSTSSLASMIFVVLSSLPSKLGDE